MTLIKPVAFVVLVLPVLSLGALPAFADDHAEVATEAPEAAAEAAADASAVEAEQTPADPYADGPDAEGFDSFAARASYAIGADTAGWMSEQFGLVDQNFDADAFTAGLRDALAKSDLRLSPPQAQETLMAFGQMMQQAQMRQQQEMMEQMMQKAETNAAAGQAFLDENAAKEGVEVSEAGVQVLFDTRGDGPLPNVGDTVLVNYEGKTLDGEVFDSSFERGQPMPFPLTEGVIPGFREGLTMMPVGSAGTLYIPGELAYGIGGNPRAGIEPNELLVFRIEVLEMIDDVDPPAAVAEQDAAATQPAAAE